MGPTEIILQFIEINNRCEKLSLIVGCGRYGLTISQGGTVLIDDLSPTDAEMWLEGYACHRKLVQSADEPQWRQS